MFHACFQIAILEPCVILYVALPLELSFKSTRSFYGVHREKSNLFWPHANEHLGKFGRCFGNLDGGWGTLAEKLLFDQFTQDMADEDVDFLNSGGIVRGNNDGEVRESF